MAILTSPTNVRKESNINIATNNSFSDVSNMDKKEKHIRKQCAYELASALLKMTWQHNEILEDKTRHEHERHSPHSGAQPD